jgi:hypothetical protein
MGRPDADPSDPILNRGTAGHANPVLFAWPVAFSGTAIARLRSSVLTPA